MIEIKCTEEQKGMIINAICGASGCASIDVADCDCMETSCVDCIERNIKWDIQPEPLKPCPCCGGKAQSIVTENFNYVICVECRLRTPDCVTEKQAAEIWNRRVTS